MEAQRLIDTYVAAPYSHPDPAIHELRFRQINAYCAAQMAAGVILYSPISHCHPIALEHALPTDWAFWERFDRAMIGCCRRLTVLTLDGWRESTGVTAEIKIALEMGIPVEYALEADMISLECRITEAACVPHTRHAATSVIASLELRIAALESGAAPVGALSLVGVQNADGSLATGLHATAGDAWEEFTDGTRMTLEAAWRAGYRDYVYRCWPEAVSAEAPMTETDALRVAADREG
jgi:hypothetical protein